MKKIAFYKFIKITLVLFFFFILSCGRFSDTVSCFPNVPINLVISLNSNVKINNDLQNNQWAYVDISGAGTRGLILVKTNNGYKCYDRNAPHICPNNKTTVYVEWPYAKCDEDGSRWILLTGEPNQVASLPLKTYPSTYNQADNTISIFY